MGFDKGDNTTGPKPNATKNKIKLVTNHPILKRYVLMNPIASPDNSSNVPPTITKMWSRLRIRYACRSSDIVEALVTMYIMTKPGPRPNIAENT